MTTEILKLLARAALVAIVYAAALVAIVYIAACEGCSHFAVRHKGMTKGIREFWEDSQQ